jgi:Dullard-like phosphatase family protein
VLEYEQSSQNVQGNYQNYVYYTLKSFIPLQKINYAEILKRKTNYRLPVDLSSIEKKTLILDLDETLIHSNFDKPKNKGIMLEFTHEHVIYSFELFLRPGLEHFLKKMSETFELILFTASKKEYADRVLEYIDPGKKYIKHCFYREDCIGIMDKIFIKDLSIFVNKRLENIIMLDNSMYSFLNQLTNGVLINSFYDNLEDTELFNVMGYLENYIANCEDVRIVNNQIFGFNDVLNDLHKESGFI